MKFLKRFRGFGAILSAALLFACAVPDIITTTSTTSTTTTSTTTTTIPYFTYSTNSGEITITGLTMEGESQSSLTMPSTIDGYPVVYIGSNSFSDCYCLSNITIPNSILVIGKYAFYCSGLTNVNIPNSVTNICEYAFYGCDNLTSVTIGDGVKVIGDFAFAWCGVLSGVIANPIVPPTAGDTIFQNCTALFFLDTIKVPPDSVDDYETAWSHYYSQIGPQ